MKVFTYWEGSLNFCKALNEATHCKEFMSCFVNNKGIGLGIEC